jgi:DNA-binding NarL/FixJ family response regulator
VISAIRTVLNAQRYMSAKIMQRLVGQAVGATRPINSDPIEQLSDRELQVFRLIGEGMTTAAIANRLNVSIHTIESHRENIRRKLVLRNGNELMRCDFQWVLEAR